MHPRKTWWVCDILFVLLFTRIEFVSPQQVKRVVLLGERNSGTNFVESILKRSLHRRYQNGYAGSYPFASKIPVVSFKHMFRHDALSGAEIARIVAERNTLWILQIRDPCAWMDAMYRKPWHMCPAEGEVGCDDVYIGLNTKETSKMTRAQFMLTPWRDNAEARNKFTSFEYANPFALRRHKLKIMLQIKRALPHRTVFSRLHVTERNPLVFLKDLQ